LAQAFASLPQIASKPHINLNEVPMSHFDMLFVLLLSGGVCVDAKLLGSSWKSMAARSLAAASLPDPKCKTGTLSVNDGSPLVCCAGYCGECSDYPTCKHVRGQDSGNACCRSQVHEMRCGNGAPANVCLKKCSESVPPCVMDEMDYQAPSPSRHAQDDCNKAVPDWRAKAAAAVGAAPTEEPLQPTDTPQFHGALPAPITVECAAPPHSVIRATDTCGEVKVDFGEQHVPGTCQDEFFLIRRWSALDCAGSTSTVRYEQTVTVVDTEPPAFSESPPDVTVTSEPPPPEITATDNCANEVQVVYASTYRGKKYTSSRKLLREWEATDRCGNNVQTTQTITIAE